MRRRRAYGVRWVVGAPQSGKTTLARHLAAQLRKERNVPVVVLDSQQVHNFADLPERQLSDLAGTVWKEPRASVRVVPRDLADVERICGAIRRARDVVLLVDEAHYWLSAQSGSSAELVGLMRATQHARADLILTTQHLTGDVPQAALSCTTEIYAFRCTSPRVLKCLETDFGLDRRQVAQLPRFQCMRKVIGFDDG